MNIMSVSEMCRMLFSHAQHLQMLIREESPFIMDVQIL